jgi:hypothetical protein
MRCPSSAISTEAPDSRRHTTKAVCTGVAAEDLRIVAEAVFERVHGVLHSVQGGRPVTSIYILVPPGYKKARADLWCL